MLLGHDLSLVMRHAMGTVRGHAAWTQQQLQLMLKAVLGTEQQQCRHHLQLSVTYKLPM